MRLIDKISGAPNQRLTIITEDGDAVTVSLKWLPSQQRWSMGLIFDTFEVNGLLLAVSPNMIRGFKNVIPFGIAIDSTDALDPMYLNDFTSGRIKFYLLSAADVLTIESSLFQ